MAAPEISARSSADSSDSKSSPSTSAAASADAVGAYEHYLRLPELAKISGAREFPQWALEPVLKPALQALEITFRLVSVVLSDARPYANRREWTRRLESLASRQLEIVGALCEDDRDGDGDAPMTELTSRAGVLSRDKSSNEVWKLPGAASVVSRSSEASLLPRLAAWEKSEKVAATILFQIENQMQRCPYTLGLGEPNLVAKPALEYDLVVRPAELHALKRSTDDAEVQALCAVHQIVESWLHAARELVARLEQRIEAREWEKAAADCWLVECAWKLLADVEDLHLLMDPDDFLRLKSQLALRAEALCFRSTALRHVTGACRELRRRVPWVLGVEADPAGGPRVQEAAMRLFHGRGRGDGEEKGKMELLQAMQAVEIALKRFFFAYRLMSAAVVGSLEASGNRGVYLPAEAIDPLAQVFLEPPYYPSLDAAKTFLGDHWWQKEHSSRSSKTTNW